MSENSQNAARNPWVFEVDGYKPDQEKLHETWFTQANGYLGVRGYTEEGIPGLDRIPIDYHDHAEHAPDQYLAHVFDRSPVTGNTMVNLPTLRLTYLHVGEEKVDLSKGSVREFHRRLDLARGIQNRSFTWTSPKGRECRIDVESFLCRDRVNVLCTRTKIVPLNWNGVIRLDVTIDGSATTIRQHHLDLAGHGATGPDVMGQFITRTSGIQVVLLRRVVARSGTVVVAGDVSVKGLVVTRSFTAEARQGEPVSLDQFGVVTASTDPGESGHPLDRAVAIAGEVATLGYDALRREQEASWSRLWAWHDVTIDTGSPVLQQRLRFCLYQLLQAYRPGNPDLSIGAKLLSGQHYAGHYFWDTEIFLLPFYLYTMPEAAHDLLMCRINRLKGAREKAARMGFRGAFYPWEGDPLGGDENCPTWWEDEKSRVKVRILCGEIELHINTAIVYGLDHYRRATGDEAFWYGPAAPVVLECARFWASRGEWSGDTFVIKDVIGPDEYHEHVDNDCYTNFTARWNLLKAVELLDTATPERRDGLIAELGITAAEVADWKRIAAAIRIARDPERGILVQDDTYLSLPFSPPESLDLSKPQYRFFKPHELTRMSMIKQASVLALHHLFPLAFDRALMERHWAFYAPRTVHDSSLSAGSHAAVAALLERQADALGFYQQVLATDQDEAHKGCEDGFHAANTGSAWATTTMAFGGIFSTREGLWCAPRLPAGWSRLSFNLVWHGRRLGVLVTPERIDVTLEAGAPIRLVLEGRLVEVGKGAGVVSHERRPRAVIFDLDGVLVDSAICHYKAWKKLAEKLGVSFDEKKNDRLRGVSRRESLMIMLEGSGLNLSPSEIEQVMEEKNALYLDYVRQAGDSLLLPGVKERLNEWRFAGLKLAVASSSRNAALLLQQAGLDQGFFHAVVDGNQISQSKPDPEVFLKAAQQLGARVEDCLVVEDAPAGVEAARGAGMRCLGIGQADLAGADTLRTSLEACSTFDVFQLFRD